MSDLLSQTQGSTFLVVLSVLGFLSFALLFVTSYVKIAVVFGLLRSALGTPQLPPTMVLTGLALVLSVAVMMPVFSRSWTALAPQAEVFADAGQPEEARVQALVRGVKDGAEPFRTFLGRHAHPMDQQGFADVTKRLNPEMTVARDDFLVLIPAFLISEITEAFQIGFLLFLPFLILDLLTANILMALGMHMVSPTAVSLPLKLLLFVAVDGFYLLSSALMLSYA
ncbi:MAG: EscR/YscR/HrcR family type III secretion system export apparatus protein [Deltaproteobacteria bacterium HGW-Deltaproteobacteria-22]|jgi:type III secretion protein R|nr:MAG: EscR/YscR/HrcR family type III secretion system export apparatus protein [Deltaproteobacteria bacterium HGW-Deltaproteobacteria-22]